MSVYFDESIDKKILICYIKSPFYFMNRPIKHSNVIESRIIADTFKNMGFNVDVVDWQCKRNIDYSKYSLIFGFGLPYRNSFSNHDINLKRICYLTGSNPNFSNKQEAMRIKKIYDDKKSLLSPRREAYWPWMNTAINSDMLVLTGNSQTKSTYEGLVENIQTVPVPIIPSKLKPNLSINSGILWFGGSGAVHKGLDLVLEAITNSSAKFTLDICGPIKGETDFFNMYQEKLNDERVNFHGMIDVSSNEMQKLIDRNSFIVLPSCSEGMASSVITCMQFGLIPIISKECGVDIGDHGILIEELSISGVKTAIYKALNLNADEILKMKKQAVEFIKKNNSHDSYRKHILNALKNFKNNTKY
tara:strand:+ start:3246 stop:4325 length:1080 start_codon:yes stop_codon:yes gene_type:complete